MNNLNEISNLWTTTNQEMKRDLDDWIEASEDVTDNVMEARTMEREIGFPMKPKIGFTMKPNISQKRKFRLSLTTLSGLKLIIILRNVPFLDDI